MLYIGFVAGSRPYTHHSEGLLRMTYLDVMFNYGAIPGENEMQ